MFPLFAVQGTLSLSNRKTKTGNNQNSYIVMVSQKIDLITQILFRSIIASVVVVVVVVLPLVAEDGIVVVAVSVSIAVDVVG